MYDFRLAAPYHVVSLKYVLTAGLDSVWEEAIQGVFYWLTWQIWSDVDAKEIIRGKGPISNRIMTTAMPYDEGA